MSLSAYLDNPVKIPASLDTSQLKGKSVLVTGGASGLGKTYSQGFAKHGAYVTVVDFNKEGGQAVVDEIGSNAQFIQCDVTNWDQLVQAFEKAIENSPNKGLDIVIANAGITGEDDMFSLEDPSGPPKKPNLKIMDVNLTGVLYTTKLAFHYFRRQPAEPTRDRCLLVKSSLAGYIDLPRSVQYNSSKFGVRGAFRCLRSTGWMEGIRVNLVAPWFVQTPIMDDAFINHLKSKGVEFALAEDCCKAMMVFACDKTINGRALGVVPHSESPGGVLDLETDDFAPESPFRGWQKGVLEVAGLGGASG